MRMKPRHGLVLLAALAVGACAPPSSSNGGGGEAAEPAAAPNLDELPQGTEPSDNMYTRSAGLYLRRAHQNPDVEEKRQRFQEALEAAINGIEMEPGNPKPYKQAAEAYLGLGDVVGADSMFTRAETIYPRYRPEETRRLRESQWVQQYNQGISRVNQGDIEGAIEFFERATTIYKGRPASMLNLGQAYAQIGETEKAIEWYREALSTIRSDAFDEQSEERQQEWREREEIAAFNMAQLLAQSGRNEEAAQAYRDFLEENPDNVTALSNLALVLSNMEMPDSAMAIYDGLLQRDDLAAQEYFSTGIGLFQAEAYSRAADAFTRAAELNPGNRDAVYNLAQTLFLSEQYEELVPAAERLVEEMDPYNPNAYRLYVQALVQTGNEDLALEYQNRMEALPFEVTGTQLNPSPDGGGSVSGTITNRTLEPGEPISLTFHWVDTDGMDIGTTEVTVEAPAPDETVSFRTELEAEEVARGFRYERSDQTSGGS